MDAAGSKTSIPSLHDALPISNGDYTFTPAANWNGSVPQVTYTTGTGASSTLDITVNAVDDASVLVADTRTVNEDNPATGNVLTNDADVDNALAVASYVVAGDGTVYAAGSTATIAGVGTLTIGANGDYTFTPAANWNGSVPQVTYTTGTGASSTLDITVNAVDDASVLVADTRTVNEIGRATGRVRTNDADVDNALAVASYVVAGDGTVYAAGSTATIAGVGTLTIGANGDYTFTPAANWNGSVPQVTYTTGTGASSTLDITVNAVDDASVLVADTRTVNEDNPATGNVLTNDADVDNALAVASYVVAGDGTVYAAGSTATIAGVGTLTIGANGDYTFTPAANWNGSVPQVTYTTGTGASSTLDITVNAVDDASVLVADTRTVNEDNPATGNVLTNDADVDNALAVASYVVAGDGTVYAAGSTATIAGVGTLTIGANGDYTFTPAANWNGSVPQVTYTTGTGASSTLDITVNAVDDASVLVADTRTVNEDNPATGNVLTNDADVDNALAVASYVVAGDGTVYAAGSTATIAGVGTLTIGANGDYTFTPAANWNGSVPQVTYTTGTGASSTLDITVNAVDDASVLVADTRTVNEDNPATGNVLTNDADVDNALAVASYVVAGDGTVYAAGSTATIAGVGTLTIGANGDYTFTPAANWNGSVPQVTYTTGTGASSTLDITVNAVDDASVLVADTRTVNEDNPATGNVLTNDADVDNALAVASYVVAGDGTVYAAGSTATIAGVGTLTIGANGDYTFTPAANWNGSVPQVTYTTGTGASSTLDITVNAVDDASVLVADTRTVNEDNPATGNVLTNDADRDEERRVGSYVVAGDGTVYAADSTATIAGVGTLTIGANGDYTFTPAANWNGSVPQVTYTTGTGASSTLDITVNAVDDASVLVADTRTVNEDNPATGNVLTNDADVDNALAVASYVVAGDGTVYAAGSPATTAGLATLTIGANGDYTFTPAANWNGSVPQVTYTTGTGASSTLDITVNAVDDASVLVADTRTVNEDN